MSMTKSFLHRRRSFGPAQFPISSESPLPPIPFPPAVENVYASHSSPISPVVKGHKTSGPGTIIRRVSTLLYRKKRRQPIVTPLNVKAPNDSSWMVINEGSGSPTESEVSLDEIRRPSGLGRAVSISSNRSLPPSPFTAIDEESPFHLVTKTGYERSRALSSPNLPHKLELAKEKLLTRVPSVKHHSMKECPPSPMPYEVLVVVLSYLPRSSVASLSTTSRDICGAARVVLYETLELRTLRPKQVELLVTVLAYRHDLTELVRTFECHTWPEFFPPQNNSDGLNIHHSSFSPALTAIFTIAFQNMHRVTTLILPSFDNTFLRHHSAFGLKNLTFLNRTMTANEATQVFAWLDGQTNITHLSFPHLLDPNDAQSSLNIPKGLHQYPNTNLLTASPVKTHDASTSSVSPSGSPVTPLMFLPPVTPPTPFKSLALLPALTTLVATPSIINSLIATGPNVIPRPLQDVTLSINNTLYTGLRPVTLLNSLYGIMILRLKFSPAVDRRTIGKVLSAGIALCTPSSKGTQDITNSDDIGKLLQRLEVEVSDSTTGADQALYKAIASSIPRYRGLTELYTSLVPELHPEGVTPTESPVFSERETNHINMWVKHCPSLQAVQLLSGARWTRARAE